MDPIYSTTAIPSERGLQSLRSFPMIMTDEIWGNQTDFYVSIEVKSFFLQLGFLGFYAIQTHRKPGYYSVSAVSLYASSQFVLFLIVNYLFRIANSHF